MRIIDYYSSFAAAANALLVFACLGILMKRRKAPVEAPCESGTMGKRQYVLLAAVFFFGMFLRTLFLEKLPYGLQQDEASIGYEAYCLANYGIDRNGYHWPVYPITWGSGGGSPLMIYLNVITTKLFGSRVFSIRIVPAVLGSLTIVLFYFLVRKIWDERTAVISAFVLSVMPWHVMISRWSLDSNTMPFWEALATLVMVYAVQEKQGRRKTLLYCLSAALYALCLYAYGSATLVVPIHLLIICLVLLKSGDLKPSQFFMGIGAALIVLLPLAVFYAVNFLGIPEIALSWISFPRFTSDHTGTVFIRLDQRFFISLLSNAKGLLRILTTGLPEEVIWNQMPGYALLYRFTFPLTFFGIGEGIIRFMQKRGKGDDRVLLVLLLVSMAFTLLIQQDYNRSVMLYLPLIYFYCMGLRVLGKASRKLSAAALVLLVLGFLSFAKDYYLGTYNRLCRVDFMSGYGEAVEAAWEAAQEKGEDARIRSTYTDVGSPFMIALYYTKYDPYDFMDTVVYKDPDAEFRVAKSFGCFTFGLPEAFDPEDDPQALYIVTEDEGGAFGESWEGTQYGHYLFMRKAAEGEAQGR